MLSVSKPFFFSFFFYQFLIGIFESSLDYRSKASWDDKEIQNVCAMPLSAAIYIYNEIHQCLISWEKRGYWSLSPPPYLLSGTGTHVTFAKFTILSFKKFTISCGLHSKWWICNIFAPVSAQYIKQMYYSTTCNSTWKTLCWQITITMSCAFSNLFYFIRQ